MESEYLVEILAVKEFLDDVRSLSKKYRNMGDDVETFKKAMVAELTDGMRVIGRKSGQIQSTVPVENLGRIRAPIFKCKKIYSRDLHVGNRFRVIYAYECDSSHCANGCAPSELDACRLIEIYLKKNGDATQDNRRIYKYYGEKRG